MSEWIKDLLLVAVFVLLVAATIGCAWVSAQMQTMQTNEMGYAAIVCGLMALAAGAGLGHRLVER